jgi:hypothetical protein
MVIVNGNILMTSESTATACKAEKTHPRPSYGHSGASDQMVVLRRSPTKSRYPRTTSLSR